MSIIHEPSSTVEINASHIKESSDHDSQNPELLNSDILSNAIPENKLSVIVQRIKNYLIVQPKLDAAAVAKASVLPLLYSFKQDIWNPKCLKLVEIHNKYLRYNLMLPEGKVSIDVWGVGQDFKDGLAGSTFPEGGPWGVRTNGSDWQLIDFSNNSPNEDIFRFSLYGSVFHEVMFQLFNTQKDLIERRFILGKSLLLEDMLLKKLYLLTNTSGVKALQQNNLQEILRTLYSSGFLNSKERLMLKAENMQEVLDNYIEGIRQGYVPIIKPLSDITLEDVKHHCQSVENLKGGLNVYFDDELLEVSSRSGYYYLLAAIAVQFGCSDSIPVEDLVRPPEQPASKTTKRFLGRPGWYLVLNNRDQMENSIINLLSRLNLEDRFKATYNMAPFPNDS